MRATAGFKVMTKAEWLFPDEPPINSEPTPPCKHQGGGVVLRFPIERVRHGRKGLAGGKG